MECTDPAAQCAASAARPDAWVALPTTGAPGPMISRPTAFWDHGTSRSSSGFYVSAVAQDGNGWLIGGAAAFFDPSYWVHVPLDLDPADPDPGIVVTPGLGFFARNASHALGNATLNFAYPPLGGVLASAPGFAQAPTGVPRVDIAALMDDHGHPGVWWRFYGDTGYTAPCNYNKPGTCAQCGCNVPGTLACDR